MNSDKVCDGKGQEDFAKVKMSCVVVVVVFA